MHLVVKEHMFKVIVSVEFLPHLGEQGIVPQQALREALPRPLGDNGRSLFDSTDV